MNWCPYHFISYHYLVLFILTLIKDHNKTYNLNGVYLVNKESFQEGFDQS